MFSALGNWALGNVMITVRPENKIGYYDRFIYLDDVMPFSEIVDVTAANTVRTRYPIAALNAVISTTTVYQDGDLVLNQGIIEWVSGHKPAVGTRLSISYLYHPVFVVIEYAHFIRTTPFRDKLPRKQQLTPAGQPQYLPLQVIARLEHLPLEAGDV
jgi:hypothetical protein